MGSTSGFTTKTLTGAVGETVQYEITVENQTILPETFSNFIDAHCEAGTLTGGPGSNPVLGGESATWMCSQVLSSTGTYTNEATVTSTSIFETSLTLTSNRVTVEVPPPSPPPSPPPKLTVEKRQQVAGGAGTFTTATLTAAVGQTLNYEVMVKNTGEGPLTLTFSDERCDRGTIKGGPGASPLPAGETTTFTCTRYLSATGSYANVATVTGTNGSGVALSVPSNRVEALVPESHPATPTVVPAPVSPAAAVVPHQGVLPCMTRSASLQGASGSKRTPFTVTMSARGVARIAFYLDGRKLKTLTASQARAGRFTIKIDPRRLAYGAHKLSVSMRMTESACGTPAHSSVFVRPRSEVHPPG